MLIPSCMRSKRPAFVAVPSKVMPMPFNLLTGTELLDPVQSLLPEHRERPFPPTGTLSMFLSQALSADRSRQRAVNEAAVKRLIGGLPRLRTHTGAYRRAWMRLPQELGFPLCRLVAVVYLGSGAVRRRRLPRKRQR